MNQIIKNSVYSLIKTISTMVFPLLSFTYSSRILLPAGMGKIDFTKSFVMYFTFLAMLGIQNYGLRECARVRDNRDALSRTAREIVRINFISAAFSYALFFAVIFMVKSLAPYRWLLLINSLTIGLTALGMEWLYNAVEDYKYISVRTCIVQIISLICMLIFIREPSDINKYAAIQVLSNGGAFVFNFIHSQKYIDWKIRFDHNCKRHLKPIFTLFLMSAFIQVFTVMDSTMLGFLTDDSSVGLYSVAVKISGIVSSAVCSVILVITPRISNYAEHGMYNEIKQITVKAVNCIFLFGIPAVIGLIMVSMPVLLLFSGEAYKESNLTSKIMAFRCILVPINTFIVLYLFIPMKEEKKNIISTSAAAILNFLLNLILIPRFYQNGAAVATVSAEFIEMIINLYFLSKFLPLKNIFMGVWQYVIAAMPIIPLCYYLFMAEFNNLLYVLTAIISAALIYFGILALIKNQLVVDAVLMIKNKLLFKKNN